MWLLVAMGFALIAWWKVHSGKVVAQRESLLARQREVAERIRPSWHPLRDKIEAWTAECAAENFAEKVPASLLREWDFRALPGVYLRVGQSAARDVRSLRESALKSLHDGFTSCLFVTDNASPIAGPECESTEECPRGTSCNELRHCAAPSQPYNVRVGYRAMRVLTDDWVANIQETASELAVRGATASFEAAEKYDISLAVELLAKARYFMAVVDEPVVGGTGAGPESADARTEDDRSIPTDAHPARVCLWRLDDGQKMLAIRRDAAGALVGGRGVSDPGARSALQRQANSCALALSVREALGVPNTPPPRD
ncbi:MAG: hypothetical protein EXR75_10465 [Myxococcales bacterium]|nr:hypothetical protein [Myxococcales bacterium]